MPSPASVRKRHLYAEPPTSAQLSALLPAPRADRLGFHAFDDTVEVVISPRQVWYVLVGLIWFGLVVAIAPWTAPLWGAEFMGWGSWLALVLLIWGLVLPTALVLLSWFIQRRHAGDTVVIVNPAARVVALPTDGRQFSADQLFQVVEVIRWARDRWRWQPVVQTSLVVIPEEGGFELLPLVTQVRPSRFTLPLADRLAKVMSVPVLRVQMDAAQSRRQEWVQQHHNK